MRILWHSVKPTICTGYGVQTALMVRQLKNLGHEVAISCSCGTPMATEIWNGIKCFPDSGHIDKYGMDMVKTHAERWKADIVFSWLDAFVIPVDTAKALGNWAAWIPIDSEPIMVRNVIPLQSTRWQIAPTKWGAKMLRNAGFKKPMVLPCAFEKSVFFLRDIDKAKKVFGGIINRNLENKFLVNVVSANAGSRKNFHAIFSAWKEFQARHSDVELYLHTDVTGYFSAGNDIIEMANLYNCNNDSVFFVTQWEYNTGQIGNDYLNYLYNASDVHLNCCYGEGFGIPIMDAQACGCPSIVPNFAAAKEVGLCQKIKKGSIYSTVPGAFQFMVDPHEVFLALERAYMRSKQSGYKKYRRSIQKAAQVWEIENVVVRDLVPILDRIESELKYVYSTSKSNDGN